MAKSLWNVKQAAAYLKCSERTVWRLKKAGEIPFVMVGSLVRFEPEALQAYVAENKKQNEG